MRAPILMLTLLLIFQACAVKQEKADENWVKLFNEKDLNDWIPKIHHYDAGENFDNTFSVKDGMVQVRYENYGEYNDRFGHLFYKTPFSNFHLKLEYRFVGKVQEGAPEWTDRNSGIMFHSQDPKSILKEQDWPISVEMQLLAPLDNEQRPTGNMCSPGTDIVYKGEVLKDHCLMSSSKSYPVGEWVKAELVVYNDSLIMHIINGDTVLQYSKPTMGGGVVNGYDTTVFKPGMPLKSGYIGLQSEGQPIDFRNIYLREL